MMRRMTIITLLILPVVEARLHQTSMLKKDGHRHPKELYAIPDVCDVQPGCHRPVASAMCPSS